MFRITFMCQTKNLGQAFEALLGIAVETPQVQRLGNAKVVNGKIRQRVPGTSIEEQVVNHLVTANIKQITAKELRMFVEKAGYRGHSYAAVTSRLARKKILKRIGPGTYEVKH